MEDKHNVTQNSPVISREGQAAPITRLFGWSMLGILAAFLINNVLIIGYGFPGVSGAFAGGGGASSFVTLLVYLIAIALCGFYVLRTPGQSLRWDADKIHKFNVFLIAGCFWSILFVGIVDAAIGLMRIEHLLGIFFSDQMVVDLGRVQFVGPNIHIPLIILGFIVAFFSRTLGFTWLALLIVIAELAIVISRFVFSYEQALMADLVRYWYAGLFLFASAYTLYEDGHVRVDVLYSTFGRTRRGFFNAMGTILLGMTTSWVILAIGFNGKQSIINSPVINFEITQSGSTGLFIKYQMAAFLGIFAISMLIQFVSYFFECVADYRDEPGHRENVAAAH